MPDSENLTAGGAFAPSAAARHEPFPLKGCGALDWGMQSRLARIFRPDTRRTVMLAIDHGYFQGPTTGLERVDLSIVPLLPYADALMTTRGMIRSTIPPASRVPIVLRASGGPSVLKELSDERLAVSMEDAARINAAAVAVHVTVVPGACGAALFAARVTLGTDAAAIANGALAYASYVSAAFVLLFTHTNT